MRKNNVLGKHLDRFLHISHEELEKCTTINEDLIPQIDCVMLGALKVAKFEFLIEGLVKNIIPDLEKEGVPSLYSVAKIKNELIDWLNDYIVQYNDAVVNDILNEEEIKVEHLVIQKITQLILKFNENN